MKSHFCRIIALVLSFSLFASIPQFSVVATLIDRDQTATPVDITAVDNAVPSDDQKIAVIVGEDESLRTENVRKFRLSDGSYIAAMYDDAVNYNENGVWKEIDNTLCLENEYYTNKANNFKVFLPEGLSENTGINIGHGEYKLSFSPLNIKSAAAKVTEPKSDRLELLKKRANEMALQTKKGVSTDRSEIPELDDDILSMDEKELKKAINNAYMSADKTESSVKYTAIRSGVDIEYSLQSDKLKESIILNSAVTEKNFSFSINANGLIAELANDGSVFFKDGEKTVFTIASPYMWDANGEYSRDIRVSLDKTKGGYTYTLVPSEYWLSAPGRAYPVTIDPTFQYGDIYTVTDKTCTFVNPLTTSDRNTLVNETFLLQVGKFYGGTEAGSLIYADVLNELNLGDARIINAQMVLKFYGYYNAANLQLNAYRVTTPISAWGNLSDPIFPSTLSISYDSSQILDYIITPADTSWLHNTTCVFDITNLAWQWQNGAANNGVLLMATNFASYGDRLVTFYDSSCGGASTDPKFVITYRNTEGLESYWTYHSQDVGRAGTGYINDYKGNLIFIHMT